MTGIHAVQKEFRGQQLTELHLRERTAFLNALLVHNPLGIIVLDTENRIQMCNPAFEEIFLYTEEETLGRDIDDLVGPADLRDEVLELTRQTRAGTVVHAEAFRARKDGTRVSVEIHSLPLIVEGETLGLFAIYQNTTERRVAEESVKVLSKRLLDIQDDERRRIAHNLHDTTVQDLAALAMQLESLCKSCYSVLSPAESLALIESTDLAKHCARELRTLSYLLYPPLLDEAGIGSAVKWYTEGYSTRTGIQVKLTISAKFKRLSPDMEMMLFRIIQESLANVYKHAGGRTVRIHLFKKGPYVNLEIADDGVGIPVHVLKALNTTGNMIGMGIAGMRERVKQFGGELDINVIGGTTVKITVPVGGGTL